MEPIGSDTAEAVPLDIAANATDVAVAEDSSASAFPWPAAGDMHPLLVHNVANTMRFAHMTEIQARTWQAASAGADVLGRARTGTGKTLAFLLPALHQILNQQQQTNQKNDMIQMLILSPTRELAAQIHTQAGQLSLSTGSKSSSLVHQVMFGGASKPKDISLLERNIPHVLVATPGRLRDHLQTTTIGKSNPRPFEHFLSKTQILVLDETDRYVFG